MTTQLLVDLGGQVGDYRLPGALPAWTLRECAANNTIFDFAASGNDSLSVAPTVLLALAGELSEEELSNSAGAAP